MIKEDNSSKCFSFLMEVEALNGPGNWERKEVDRKEKQTAL